MKQQDGRRGRRLKVRVILGLLAAVTLAITGCSTGSSSGSGSDNVAGAKLYHAGDGNISSLDLRSHSLDSVKGKTLAYVPLGMSLPLTAEWSHVLQERAQELGMKYIVRDPNLNPSAEAQAVASLIPQHPDVMIVHNPDVELLANQIKQAQQAGIYVIQINMVSNYKSDAYVGADWQDVGTRVGNEVVKDCGAGTSGKVEVIEGPKTAAASIDQVRAFNEVMKQHPNIKIVSDQAGGNWDPAAARTLAQTVLRANPDLCGIYALWDVMGDGALQAVKAEGLQGKVKMWSEGDQSPVACQDFKAGLLTYDVTYSDPLQAQQMMDTAVQLLQSGLKPGTVHWALYSPLEEWTADKIKGNECYTPGKTLPGNSISSSGNNG